MSESNVCTNPARQPESVYRRRRVAALVAVVAPLVMVAVVTLGAGSQAQAGRSSGHALPVVTVGAGGSWWSVAQGCQMGGDVRDVVLELHRLNPRVQHLDMGDRLRVPADCQGAARE